MVVYGVLYNCLMHEVIVRAYLVVHLSIYIHKSTSPNATFFVVCLALSVYVVI